MSLHGADEEEAQDLRIRRTHHSPMALYMIQSQSRGVQISQGSKQRALSTVRGQNRQRKGNLVSSPICGGGDQAAFPTSLGTYCSRGCIAQVLLTKLLAYDEEDDGFAFTRTRAKKAKAEAVLASTSEGPGQEERAEPAPTRKPKKKATSSPKAAPIENGDQPAKRRSSRHSGEHENADPPPLPVKKRRKDRAPSEQRPDPGSDRPHTDQERIRQEPPQDQTQPIEVSFDATKIALPFADTPIIRRNKEMRKTNANRRSSLGMRGRRASSLIDTGKSNGAEFSFVFKVLTLTLRQPCLMTKSRARNSTST